MNDLEVNDLGTDWLKEGNVLGRPVDIIINDDGSLFVGGDTVFKHHCHNNNSFHNNIPQK